MKRILFAVLAVVAMALAGGGPALAHNDTPHKVVVCKYVGTPGEDERLQTGNNPIVVDAHSLEGKGFDGTFPFEFSDAQGRSIAIRYAADSHDGDISECPGGDQPSPSPSVEPTSTPTPTVTPSDSPSPSVTPSPQPSEQPSESPTSTPEPSSSPSPTFEPSPTPSQPTPSVPPTPTSSASLPTPPPTDTESDASPSGSGWNTGFVLLAAVFAAVFAGTYLTRPTGRRRS